MAFRVGDVVGNGRKGSRVARFVRYDTKYGSKRETWGYWGSYESGVFFRESVEYTHSPCTLHLPKEFLNGF